MSVVPEDAGGQRKSRRWGLLTIVTAGLVAACTPPARHIPFAGELEPFLTTHPLAGGQNIRVDEIGRTATASFHVVQVRVGETPHRHEAHELTVVVLRGAGTLSRGTGRATLTAGDAAVIPRGEPHWFTNGGRAPAVALVIFMPPLDAPDTEPVR